MPEKIARLIEEDFGLRPVVATEIEFYLHGASEKLGVQEILSLIASECGKSGIPLACTEAERGPNQYEISLRPSADIARIVEDTNRFKALMPQIFSPQGVHADFAAKPRRNAPGSGLHIHVHLEDGNGKNVFFREAEEFSPMLLHAVGGLLALLNPCMSIFAPYPESYDRFRFTENAYLICPAAANIPLTVSWGLNNRTAAVRLPSKPADNKHIEHRVAGSDADVSVVITAVLMGMHYGMKEKCDPGAPIYGDASLLQYRLPKLAQDINEAIRYKNGSEELRQYQI